MNGIQIFDYEGNEIRTVQRGDETWWVLKDVCAVLGLRNPTIVADRLDSDERAKFDLGRQGETNIVNESGLYNVILRSDKPEAKGFKRWVTHEVLPSIRKHGMYAIDDLLDNPDLLIEAAMKLKEERQRRLLAEMEKNRLEAELDRSKEWYSIKRVAAINGVSWKTFKWRELKQASEQAGIPARKIFDANYGEVNVYHAVVWESLYPDYEL